MSDHVDGEKVPISIFDLYPSLLAPVTARLCNIMVFYNFVSYEQYMRCGDSCKLSSMLTVGNLKLMLKVFGDITPGSQALKNTFAMCKNKHRPVWEDEENIDAGRWVLLAYKGTVGNPISVCHSVNFVESLIIYMILAFSTVREFRHRIDLTDEEIEIITDQFNCLVITNNQTAYKITIWTKNKNKESVEKFREIIIKILDSCPVFDKGETEMSNKHKKPTNLQFEVPDPHKHGSTIITHDYYIGGCFK